MNKNRAGIWCSHLPLVDVPIFRGGIKQVTFVYPYYENPEFLERQLKLWSSYSDDLRQELRVIVSDDGSPDHPAEKVIAQQKWPFKIRLFRMGVDIRWNWPAAKNVAMYHADPGFCLLTDMDHMVPEQTLWACVYGKHSSEVIYGFSRTGAKNYPHPNSWFMTKDMYWRVGGYNEANAGYYGNDGAWRKRCAATAPMVILRDELICCEHEGDASTTRYKRKQPEDAKGKRILAEWGLKRPPTLTFPYEEIPLT